MPLKTVVEHPWDVSTAEARQIQEQLRSQVRSLPLGMPVRTVAGIDVSIKRDRARAAVACLAYPELEPIEAATADVPVKFPYVPGLLAFREGPPALAALAKLKVQPDVLVFDAHGVAHPRRLGLAAHLGVVLDVPSVGCAKSRLVGTYRMPGERKGSWAPLVDNDEVIGAVVRTRDRVRPVFVSVGHRVDLETAIAVVLGCAPRYRVPEPTRWAHRVAGGAELPGKT
jgi:deoxyribonuclease V